MRTIEASREDHPLVVDTMTETTRRVIEAVAEEKGVSFDELDPLYGVLDPEALDALFESSGRDLTLAVRFQYEEFTVAIDSAGKVDLYDRSNNDSGDDGGGVR